MHPRNFEGQNPKAEPISVAAVPSKVLDYLLEEAFKEEERPVSEYRRDLQTFIHDIVKSEEGDYMELTEVCPDASSRTRPSGAIAATSSCNSDGSDEGDCCYFVLPEEEAKRFEGSAPASPNARRSLRESGSFQANDD